MLHDDDADVLCFNCRRVFADHTMNEMAWCAQQTTINSIIEDMPESGTTSLAESLWRTLFAIHAEKQTAIPSEVASMSGSRARTYMIHAITMNLESMDDWITLLRWIWVEGFLVGKGQE